MDIAKFIEELEVPVSVIPEDRGYWLVRTQGGEYYDEFFHDNFIGIGWDEFCDIERFRNTPKDTMIKEIKDVYKTEEEDEKQPQPGRIYGSIYRFLFNLNIGDIVIIPSTNSSYISFGIITSEPYIANISETAIDAGVCPFRKRRNVEWLKTVKRNKLDPYLYWMMQTHQAISNASDYSENIDRTMYSFYIKGHSAHLVVDVKQEAYIPAMDIINYVNTLLDMVPLFVNPDNPEETFRKEQIDLKLNIQSPGNMDFFTTDAPYIILILGGLIVGFIGGKIKNKTSKRTGQESSFDNEFELESDGFMEKFLKFMKHRDETKLKLLQEQHKIYMERLKANVPDIKKDKDMKKSDQD